MIRSENKHDRKPQKPMIDYVNTIGLHLRNKRNEKKKFTSVDLKTIIIDLCNYPEVIQIKNRAFGSL